jgi:hypothetical protein
MSTKYELHVTTWECDADHHLTKILENLSRDDVTAFVELAKKFASTHATPPGVGNHSVADDVLVEAVQSVLTKYPDAYYLQLLFEQDAPKDYQGDISLADFYWQALCESLLDYPVIEPYQDEYHFCRVYCVHKVYEVPVAKVDVTECFQ